MRIQSLFIATVFFAFVTPAIGQRAPTGEQCFMGKSQIEARQCLEVMVKESGEALQTTEDKVRHTIKQSDEDSVTRSRIFQRFEAATLGFKKYRDQQCNYQAALAVGGTGASHRRLLCVLELNQQRTAHLQN